MTFSIVARSADGESWGVAVASKFLAVGSAVPAAVAGVGAHRHPGRRQRRLQGPGARPPRRRRDRVGRPATAARGRRRPRRTARSASSTSTAARPPTPGHACLDWAGGVTGDGYAIQGNILAGEEVVLAMEAAWETTDDDAPLGRRLLAALTAGDDAGGDSRGPAVGGAARRPRGRRVRRPRRHRRRPAGRRPRDPVTELARLLDLNDLYLTASTEEEKIFLTAGAEARGRREGARRSGSPDFHAWVGTENYEMRAAPDRRVDRRADPRDRPRHRPPHERPRHRRRHHRRHRGRRRRGRVDRGQGLPGVRPALPAAGLGRARARRRSGRPPSRPPARSLDAGRRRRAAGGRHHQPARDDPAVGPRDARLAAAGDRLAGPAYRRHLRPAARPRATRSGSPS